MFGVKASTVLPEEIHKQESGPSLILKRGIWLYFLLLIFEGALRKWVLPGLSAPLLIIRDPLVIWLLFKAYQKGVFKLNGYIIVAWVLIIISFYTTLFFGHGDVFVALFGFRIFFLHFPLIFLVPEIFEKRDVEQIGTVLMWLHIGMTVLVAIQFFSPQTAWVNKGIGEEAEGSGFSGGGGYFRVPGTFSFTNGLSMFYGLVSVFVFYFWLEDSRKISRGLLLLATISLVAAIPLSISRTVFFQFVLTGLFAIFTTAKKTKTLFRILGSFLSGIILFYFLSMLDFFQTAIMAFTERFTSASEEEGGLENSIIDRFLAGSIAVLTNELSDDFWGAGLGIGTNVGASLLTGRRAFLISEGEWGRLIGEMGPLLGFLFITIRIVLVSSMFTKAWKVIGQGNYLPWLLFSFGGILVLMGTWGQPTALGFAVFSGGLILAAMREKDE